MRYVASIVKASQAPGLLGIPSCSLVKRSSHSDQHTSGPLSAHIYIHHVSHVPLDLHRMRFLCNNWSGRNHYEFYLRFIQEAVAKAGKKIREQADVRFAVVTYSEDSESVH